MLGEWNNEEAAALQMESDAYEVARFHAKAAPRSEDDTNEVSATDRCLLTFQKAYRLLARLRHRQGRTSSLLSA